MTRSALTVTLNPAVDKSVIVENFRPGRDYRCREIHASAGGKGINVARALRFLGVPAQSLAFTAGPSGRFIADQLKAEKISGTCLEVSGETRTSLTIIDAGTRRSTRILEPGPAIAPRDTRKFLKIFEAGMRRSRFVALCGRNAAGLDDGFYGQLIQLARRREIPVLLDTSGSPFKAGLRQRPFACKPNRKEAEFVFGRRLRSAAALKKALQSFRAMGVREVIISLAADGAVATDGREWLHVRPPSCKVINSVGCGDALVAGYLAGRLKKMTFAETLRYAVAAGSVNAMSIQPGHLRIPLVRRLARQVKVAAL